jgi:hypothetical protein
MAEMKQSADVTVTAFEILQAVTGELPCHASPNWERVRQEESPAREEPRGCGPGSLGMLKDGKARMKQLSANRRTETRTHAMTRWKHS